MKYPSVSGPKICVFLLSTVMLLLSFGLIIEPVERQVYPCQKGWKLSINNLKSNRETVKNNKILLSFFFLILFLANKGI